MMMHNVKSNLTHSARTRLLSVILVLCLIVGMLPTSYFNSKKIKAATVPADPLKDYTFDDSNVVTLDLFDGNYIYIYDDGYVQSSTADTTKTNIIAHTGNYILKGTTGNRLYLNKISGTSDIKLYKVNCTAITSSILANTTVVIDTYVKTDSEYNTFKSDYTKYTTLNFVGVNGGQFIGDLTACNTSDSYAVWFNNVNISNLTGLSNINAYAMDSINIFSTDATNGQLDLRAYKTVNLVDVDYKNETMLQYSLNVGCQQNTNQATTINITGSNFTMPALYESGVHLDFRLEGADISLNNSTFSGYKPFITGKATKCTMESTLWDYCIPSGSSSTVTNIVDVVNSRKYSSTTFFLNESTSTDTASNSHTLSSCTAIFDRVSFGGSNAAGAVIPYNFTAPKSFLNPEGDELFPSVLTFEGHENQWATVYTDEWDTPARLCTDHNGYLYPWLTDGEHEVNVVFDDESEGTTDVTPSPDFKPTPTPVFTPVANKQNINIGLPSTEVKYGYNNTTWSTGTTDESGILTVDVTSGQSDFYIKTTIPPVIAFHAPIVSDVIGTVERIQPTISKQSTSIMVKRNATATLYVVASPSCEENSLSFEWYRGETKLDSNTNICEVQATDDSDFTTYQCKITETNGSTITSNAMTITEDTSASGLASELDELKKKHQELQDELDDSKDKVTELEGELSTSKEDNSSLKTEIENLKKEIVRLQGLIDTYLLQISDLETEVERLENELATKSATLSEKEEEIKGYKKKIEELTGDLNDAINENTSLRQLVDQIKKELGVSADTEIITAIQALKDRITSLAADKTTLQSQLDTANNTILELEAQVSSLTDENGNLKKQIDTLKSEKQTLQDKITELTNTNKDLLEEIAALEESNRTANSTIETLRSNIVVLENKIATYETTINNLTITVNSYTELLTQIRTALNVTTNDDILSAITALKDKITSLESTNKTLKDDLDTANTRITILDELVKTKSEENTELQKQIDTLKKEKETLTNQVTTLTATIEDLNKRIKELESSISDANTTITNLRQEILELNLTISEQNTTILEAKSTITSLESLIELIKTALGVTTNEEIIPAIEALKESLSELTENVNDLTKDKQSLIEKLDKEKAAKDSLSTFIEQIRILIDVETDDDITTKITDYQNQLKEKDILIAQLTTESTKKDQTIKELNEQIDQLKKKVEELTLSISSDKGTLLKQIEELTTEINKLKATIITLETEIEGYKQSISELSSEVTTLKEEIIRLKYELECANKTIEELQKDCVDANTQNDLLKDELAAANEKIAQLEKENTELTTKVATITTLEDENKKLNEEILSLKAQLSAVPVVEKSTPELAKEAVIVTPVADTTTMITTTETAIEATSGWEVSTDLTDSWSDALDTTELFETNALFTFYTGADTASAQSVKSEKKVIYTRKKEEPDNVYICSVGIPKSESGYQSPSFSITSNIKGIDLVSSESNKEQVSVTKKVKINVSADCGTIGLKGIYYKVVAYDNDFDPDGSWTPINKASFTYKVTEPVRIYIKVEDNNGNYTVSKTVVVKPYTEAPTFNMNKNIYLNSSYSLKIDADKGTSVTYSSADKSVASVTSKGKITAKKKGNTIITAIVKDCSTKEVISTYKTHVYVKDADDSFNNYSLKDNYIQTSLSDAAVLQQYKLLYVGKSSKLKISADDDASIVYITTNKNIATVSKTGVLKGIKKGSANILVSIFQDGKSYVYAVKVRVSDGTAETDTDSYLK